MSGAKKKKSSKISTHKRKKQSRKNRHKNKKQMKKAWTVWKYAVGSFSDERTHDHDNRVAVIRTVIVVVNVLTCLIIVANIIHNW